MDYDGNHWILGRNRGFPQWANHSSNHRNKMGAWHRLHLKGEFQDRITLYLTSDRGQKVKGQKGVIYTKVVLSRTKQNGETIHPKGSHRIIVVNESESTIH